MKLKIIVLLFMLAGSVTFSQNEESEIYIASWNLENLFDNIDDPDKRDSEWLVDGAKQWSNDRLDKKIKNLSKIIRYMNDLEGPDILGVQEVEHQHLLDTLLSRHFCDKNYKISYSETLDRRGIDNGVIYNADKFEHVETLSHEVKLDSGYPTRYVFQTTLQLVNSNVILHTFVNHWPSRRGGKEKSNPNRVRAAETLVAAMEKIYVEEENPNIFIIGDFNDEPENESLLKTLGAAKFFCDSTLSYGDKRFYNLSYDEFSRGWGTYLFRGNWNMLDQIIVSRNLIDDTYFNYICNSFEIIKPELMVTRTGPYKGAARPTFGGRTYLGGFSDHFAVGAKFIIVKE